jgi:predicted metal-dependent phosphoesterase TrpH
MTPNAMLKVELHTHTGDDPIDTIPHSTLDLIDRAADLGYDAVAITLHEKQLDLRRFEAHAAERRIVLIPGVERTIEGRHVLLLNFRRGADEVLTFADLAQLKSRERGLVIAPHPFFPHATCLGGDLERHADLFDAVERNAMYTRAVDFNRRAERWAAAHGKPIVGNGDVHRLRQLGTTYSLVDAPPDADAICAAIAAGRVQVESQPLSCVDAALILSAMLFGIETGLGVRDTGRACPKRRALAPSIGGWPISSGDISQS